MTHADVLDYDAHFPPEYEAGHTAGLRLLRVAARTRVAGAGLPAVLPGLGVDVGGVGATEDWHGGSRRVKQ